MSKATKNKNAKGAKAPDASASKKSPELSGIPAVLKYKGKKYTKDQILGNKNLQKELIEIGYFKQNKKK